MKRLFKYRDAEVDIKENLDKTYSVIKIKNIEKEARDILRLRNLELSETLGIARKSGFALTISDIYDDNDKLIIEMKIFHHEGIETIDTFMYIFINFIKDQLSLPNKDDKHQETEPWSTIKRYDRNFNILVLTPEEVLDKEKIIRFDVDFGGLNYRKIGASKYHGRKFEFGEFSGEEKCLRFEGTKNDLESLRGLELQKEIFDTLKKKFGIIGSFKLTEGGNVEFRFLRHIPKYQIKYYDIFKEIINIIRLNKTPEYRTLVEYDVYSNEDQYKYCLGRK